MSRRKSTSSVPGTATVDTLSPSTNTQAGNEHQQPNLITTLSSPSNDWSSGKGLIPGRETLGPLFLMISTPIFSIVFYHVCVHLQGNFIRFIKQVFQNGFFSTLYTIWPTPWDLTAWKLIVSFLLFELFLMKYVPGDTFKATITPKGNQPIYTVNGMKCYLITLFTLVTLTALGWIRPAVVYDKFGNIISSMNVLAYTFCAVLYIKGHVAPSTSDSGTNGNFMIDFYWGMELYPRILGWDVKMFTNCRAGMMFWAVGILCFAHKNIEIHQGTLSLGMAINVILQLIYISKFFYWEMGYMCSMDIQHDRAGYYICWGCLVWVPSVYTSHSFYLATHAPSISIWTGIFIFILGFACVWINYDADNQRYLVRQTKGKCTFWGKSTPPKVLHAQYTTSKGEVCKSILLVDGWWAVSRHFHYLPEILGAFFWSLPALNTSFVAPYFYVIFLTILLVDRAFRDDDRCQKKYGIYWDEYCKEVPYRIVPGLL